MESTYQDRNEVLISIGFNTYLDYLKSPLWQAIRKEVLIRDGLHCRAKRCSQTGVKHAHHVSYAKSVLMGLSCGRIITLCDKHHEEIEFDSKGNKVDLRQACWNTLVLTTGIKPRKGVSDRRIGFWFRDQGRTSVDTGIRVIKRLQAESPEWWIKVLRYLKTMPKLYARYKPSF